MSNLTGYKTPHNESVKKLLALDGYTGVIYRVQNGPNYAARAIAAGNTIADLTPYPSEQVDLTLPAPVEVNPGSGDGLEFEEACEDVPCDTFNYNTTQCESDCE